MITIIDDNRSVHGVEPICRILPIAQFTYHGRVAQPPNLARLPASARQNVGFKPEIARVFAENSAA